ncbi:hypothetical protein MPTK1_7g10300 [Marchantia polymorpha subsp. ruderalis]|uniref:Uncharacterized protein n=2 Tax=Marchantia polymorpha TaxID=3197 RepID=A0AAF6BY22_MARPO|nr:hypothetical protein MARPO_0003s0050 [Marchantia polymorpha]BBN16906.1 hypothetical protein Mp_7g10300 [Marchantia polymorpha subsp. ruderalis]|eukprot:PTQ49147.1 hypothetical protein MARPO_0003s0050 [Marchantia polymorpha]
MAKANLRCASGCLDVLQNPGTGPGERVRLSSEYCSGAIRALVLYVRSHEDRPAKIYVLLCWSAGWLPVDNSVSLHTTCPPPQCSRSLRYHSLSIH